MESAGGGEPGFPLLRRVVVVSAILLLVVYAGLAITRIAAVGRPQADPQAAAELLAARAEARLAPLEVGARASLAQFSHAPGEPLDAAEQALRLARPQALAAAVIDDQEVQAQTGSTTGVAWTSAVAAARHSGRPLWIGRVLDEHHPRSSLVYVVAGEPSGRAVVLASDLAALTASAHGEARVLASSDGAILAASGVDADPKALSGLGLDPSEIKSGATVGRAWIGAHRRASVSTAVSGQLIGVVEAPPEAPAIAFDLYGLAAPLLIGFALLVLLRLQSRKAETARAAQSESERKFRLAVEAARCGIWEWRLREERVFMSDVTGVMLGWGGGGFATSEDVIAHVAPEHRDRVRQALRGASAFGAFDVTFCVPRPDGGKAWIDARGQAFGEPDAQGFQTVLGVALDVTDEKAAEQRAQWAERRLHDAIDSVSEAFVLWDRRGRLLMCNQNYRDFFSLEARILKPGASHDEVQKMAALAIRRQVSGATGQRGARELEMTDGRWLQISERRTADGGLVMTAADISAVKRQEQARRMNEEALQHAVARLEDSSRELSELAEKYQAEKIRAESANTAKSEFLANMSHELRTPLNAVNGFSEMMVNEMFGPLGDRRYKEYARDILSSGQHLLALINDILDMSKIEAGKLNLNLDWMEVGEVVEDALRLMHNRAEAANLALVSSVAAGLPEIEGDYRAIKQVLLNLLSNALKFTPAGGRIEVKAWELGESTGEQRVRISVSDTGIGIARDDIARLGRPFEQIETQHSKTQQGTGLGLALTRSLVEMHDGVFELESEAGLGTTATVTLPVRRAQGATTGAPPTAGALAPSA